MKQKTDNPLIWSQILNQKGQGEPWPVGKLCGGCWNSLGATNKSVQSLSQHLIGVILLMICWYLSSNLRKIKPTVTKPLLMTTEIWHNVKRKAVCELKGRLLAWSALKITKGNPTLEPTVKKSFEKPHTFLSWNTLQYREKTYLIHSNSRCKNWTTDLVTLIINVNCYILLYTVL